MNEKPQGERWCTLPHAPWCPECRRERDRMRGVLNMVRARLDLADDYAAACDQVFEWVCEILDEGGAT